MKVVPASRGRFCTAGAAALASIALVKAPARAAQYVFRCGSIQPSADLSTILATRMMSTLERESGGRIHWDFFPDGTLGGDQAQLQQLRAGALQFLITTAGNLSSVIPSFDIVPLGFAFKDPDQAAHVFDGQLGDFVRQETTAKGMHALRTFWDLGMFEIASNTHPIRTPDDLRGFKLRVTSSKITVDLFKELGAITVPLSGIEVYSSLQTKLIDGEASPLVTIEAFRFYELNKYIALSNHAWGAITIIANGDMWKSLPPDIQDLIERVGTRYGMMQRKAAKESLSAVTAQLAKQGMIFNTIDQSQFRARLGSYYQQWSSAFGSTAWGLLQNTLGRRLA